MSVTSHRYLQNKALPFILVGFPPPGCFLSSECPKKSLGFKLFLWESRSSFLQPPLKHGEVSFSTLQSMKSKHGGACVFVLFCSLMHSSLIYCRISANKSSPLSPKVSKGKLFVCNDENWKAVLILDWARAGAVAPESVLLKDGVTSET